MAIILKAKCRIFEPNYRIIRAQFDLERGKEAFGEYIVVNLLRERGVLQDERWYRFIIEPLTNHKA